LQAKLLPKDRFFLQNQTYILEVSPEFYGLLRYLSSIDGPVICMSKQRKPEDELFRRRMDGVTRLEHDTIELRRPKARRRIAHELHEQPPAAAWTDAEGPVTVSDTPELMFKRPGIQDKLLRKLRRGQIPIAGQLDLHGMTIPRAQAALGQFMTDVGRSPGQCCVQLIHGKGHGSKDRVGVIKQQLQVWLQCNKNVLAYSTCRPEDGGTGAMYVLLKNQAVTQ
jgi:DNA-nicking Smr family endonuclease